MSCRKRYEHQPNLTGMNPMKMQSSSNQCARTLLNPQRFQCRRLLQTVSSLIAVTTGATLVLAEDLPRNTNPRAISGDSVEPAWDQRVTVTVGQKEADLAGSTDKVIQAAVDYVA